VGGFVVAEFPRLGLQLAGRGRSGRRWRWPWSIGARVGVTSARAPTMADFCRFLGLARARSARLGRRGCLRPKGIGHFLQIVVSLSG
jgi:hypothetical protein